jgi:GNAT superfamily N-acetyltransferase
MADVDSKRLKVRSMLSLSAPADALYAYYAFYHERERSRLYVHEDAAGRADGFVAVCQTAQRLFQPTVVLRTPNVKVAVDLLRQALEPGRPYYLITTPDLRESVSQVVKMDEPKLSRIYELKLSRFEYQVNVMVVADDGVEGRPRFLVRSGDLVVAEAGVTWLSPQFAGIHAEAAPAARRRGLGESVLAACTRWVVRSGRHPLIIAAMKDDYGTTLAEKVGYVDSGARELASDVVCCE